MEQQVSGEEFRQMSVSSQTPKSPHKHTLSIPIVWVVIVIVVGALCFLVGDHYGKAHAPKAVATTSASRSGGFAGGGAGGFGGSARSNLRAFGTVSSISSTSITIQDPRSGSSNTYSITSSTTITDNGQTVDYTDIQSGDTVILTKASSSSSDASSIMVNPSFGGGPASGSSSSGSN